jgi:Protein of unknown function (DUF2889)
MSTASGLPLHPLHGVHAATVGTPPRRPGSVRRTSAVDALRPEAERPLLVLSGRARDVVTASDGAAELVAEAALELEVDEGPRVPVVKAVSTWPAVEGLDALVGRPAGAGFRRALDAETASVPGSCEYLLLDEVPLCALVSFYAVLHADARRTGANPVPTGEDSRDIAEHPADACAGFVSGGTIMRAMGEGARAISTGPAAPSLLTDDADGWHAIAPDRPGSDLIRRWRRTDVSIDDAGDLLIDSLYRDSHTTPEGFESVVHEYTLRARVDSADGRVVECAAEPRVLPFVECLPAALSAERAVGMRLDELRQTVRRELTGPSTCTHLNDQLRGLADVETLARHLPGPAAFVR